MTRRQVWPFRKCTGLKLSDTVAILAGKESEVRVAMDRGCSICRKTTIYYRGSNLIQFMGYRWVMGQNKSIIGGLI